MSSPALALTPVPIGTGTGAGANTGPARQPGHRHHAARKNADGKQENGEAGALRGPSMAGKRPASPSPSTVHAALQHVAGAAHEQPGAGSGPGPGR